MILYFSRQPQNQLRYNIAIKSHIILLILIVQVYMYLVDAFRFISLNASTKRHVMVASKHNYWLGKSKKKNKIYALYIYKYCCGHAPFI